MKKVSNKKGIAIITSLGVCFVLLALGTVLMINSYAHMNIARRFHYEADARYIAEAGVNWEIFQLEQNPNFQSINVTNENLKGQGTSPYGVKCGRGGFKVSIFNNPNGNDPVYWAEGNLNIPPHCIGIKSTGYVPAGSSITYNKTISVVVGYRQVTNTVSSEGTIRMNVGNDEEAGEDPVVTDPHDPPKSELRSFTAVIDAIDGYTGNIHSNFVGEKNPSGGTNPSYRCTKDLNCYVHLEVDGGTMSTCGVVGKEAEEKINTHGGVAAGGATKKKLLDTNYNTLYDTAKEQSSFISLDDKVPWPVKFKGKMRNDDGDLEAYTNLGWLELDSWYGNFTPNGMSWDSDTGTLIIEEGKNYTWKKDLELKDVNIKVNGTKGSSLFVEGNITASNIEIAADAFSLASHDKDITLNNASLNITAPQTSNGVALYTKNLTITTDPGKAPAGGNRFKGVVYAKGGTIDVTNQYTADPNNNKFELEGLVINPDTDPNDSIFPCLKVKNKGSDNFTINLKYNPIVANSIIDYKKVLVDLQPLYWQIE